MLDKANQAASPRYVADLSLALINRTGAYHVCNELLKALPEHFSETRYWRLHPLLGKAMLFDLPNAGWPDRLQGLARRALGKVMLFELSHTDVTAKLPFWDRGTGGKRRTLFLDPLYVLHSRLDSRDIVLCHDVGPVSMPALYGPRVADLYRRAYARILEARPGMVFVSAASRTDFIARFGADFPFLEAIPLYVRAGSREGAMVAPPAIPGPFLLTVAAFETRKNYVRSIEGFVRSGLRARGYSYVICGPRGNECNAIADLAARTPGVIHLGFLSERELRWVYRHAAGFVLPSLIEGFGLPALEAAQHGLLSVISRDGALCEAVGGESGAILVDPSEPDDIARGLCELLDLPAADRSARLAVARRHADELTFERYRSHWSNLLRSA